MPVYLTCPEGHRLAALPEWAGTKVKCPLCQQIIVVPAPAEPVVPTAVPVNPATLTADEDTTAYRVASEPKPADRAVTQAVVAAGATVPRDLDDDPEAAGSAGFDLRRLKKPKRSKRERLSKVSVGLTLYSAKYICLIVGKLLLISGVLLTPVASGFVTFTILGLVSGWLAAPIVGIIGSCFCAFAPAKSRARPLVIALLTLESVALILGMLCLVLSLAAGTVAAATAFVFLILCYLASVTAFILFMIVLRFLALYLNEHGTADEAISVMIFLLIVELGGAIALIVLGFIFLELVGPEAGRAFLIVLNVVWLIVIIQVLFRILELLGVLRKRLASS